MSATREVQADETPEVFVTDLGTIEFLKNSPDFLNAVAIRDVGNKPAGFHKSLQMGAGRGIRAKTATLVGIIERFPRDHVRAL